VQRGVDFTKPAKIDLASVQQEVTTNYTSYVSLITHFLPHLQAQAPKPVALMTVTSGLALVPMPRCPNYCATKAALHSLTWTLRAQLAHDEASKHIKIIEIIPPAVQTELHELQEDLRAQGMANFGMPIEAFTEECWAGLVDGLEEIPIGTIRERFAHIEDGRKEAFKGMVKMTLGKGPA
jgi:short-subunit dehydrogenase involved in D-alanine esterification of teichoic acids